MTETVLSPLDPDGLVWEHFGRYYVDPTGQKRLQGSKQDRSGRSNGEVCT
jgi:hypothetical protein